MEHIQDTLDMCMDACSRSRASYFDVRYERIEGSEISLKDREVREAVPVLEEGVGVRVLLEGAWGFASTNRLVKDEVLAACDAAVRLARMSATKVRERTELAPVKVETDKVVWKPIKDPRYMSFEDKAALLFDMDKVARAVKGVHTMSASFADAMMSWAFRSSEGARLSYIMPSTMVAANVVAREGSDVTGFRTRVGGVEGLEVLDEDPPLPKVSEAAEKAVAILKGKRCPSGRMPVIADGELTGVFVHEALGHACEGDLVMAGESILEGRMGQKVGSPLVTVIDDPTIKGAFGSFPFDDEGVRAMPKVLVKEGILRDIINSRSTAAKLGMTPNGGCRAQDFSSRPIVRMSNTMLQPGDMTFEELLEGIDMGVYVKGSRGGQVDTAQGSFQFNAQEAYLIENGVVGSVLKDASLSGSTLKILSDIDGLGKEMGRVGVGFCGKGQWVPVGDGGPHMRVRSAIVGGG